MTTRFEEPLVASQTTQVADMPPLEVVTEGIPLNEHVEPVPAAQGWGRRMWAWALAGVMGFLLVLAGVLAFPQYSTTGEADLTVPPVGSDVGEPASQQVYAGPLEGPAVPYIQGMSIPAIPAITDVSISIPAISPMPDMSIPSVPAISVPSVPDMSIPSIPPFEFPAISPTPPAPATGAISVPEISIPDMSIPDMSIPAIAFPSFPSIPSISIPSFPEISVPTM